MARRGRRRSVGVRARNKPLCKKKPCDYNPFKRSDELGPGPKRQRNTEQKDWECTWREKYVQKCVFVGEEGKGYKRGRVKIIRIDPAYKKRYNKEYWDFLVQNREEGKAPLYDNKTQANYEYRKPGKRPSYKGRRRKRS